MPRPRFQNLSPEKRQIILDAAAAAFAEHGFEGASYNQIIEAAGVSKGAMYYYFDDKSDLFAAAARAALGPLLAVDTSPPAIERAEDFWPAVEAFTGRCWAALAECPKGMALGRAALTAGAGSPAASAIADMIASVDVVTRAWLQAGRGVGAVREDIPLDLLAAMLMGLGQSFDTWLLDHIEELGEAEALRLVTLLVPAFKALASPPA